jgi:FlaA1/EpsC-like NDP-sugar epimerase
MHGGHARAASGDGSFAAGDRDHGTSGSAHMIRLRNGRLRRWLKRIGDGALLFGAYYAAFGLRFEGALPEEYWHTFVYSAPLVVLTKLILLQNFGLYRSAWRYLNVPELASLAKALTLGSLLVTADYAIAVGFVTFPRSIILFDWCLSLLALAAFRALPRLLHNTGLVTLALPLRPRQAVRPVRQRILLYGAGDLGASLAEQIQTKHSSSKHVLGFIDDDPALAHLIIHGVAVLGDRSVLPRVAERLGPIDQIVVAISAIGGRELHAIVDLCRQYSPNVQVAPGLEELFLGKVSVNDLREVQIEDLLGRESAQLSLDGEQLQRFIGDQTILVTGAGGSIGSELCFQILKFRPRKLILFGRGENSIYATKQRLLPHAAGIELEEVIGDISNLGKVDSVFQTRRPSLVFHAAAHKHVPLMEINPDEAVLSNIIGTQNVLTAALEHGVARVVCISSDKAVNPSSVMGCSKRVTELLVQSPTFAPIASAVRFGNVLGSRGSVIPLFKRQIAEGGPITITDPAMTRYFMTIPEAVLLVLQAGAVSRGGDIFLLDMGQPVRLLDLARQMIRLSGLREEDVPIEFIGLRPGEKLFEELTFADETLEPTEQGKLYRLNGPSRTPWNLQAQIRLLRKHGANMDFAAIHRTLHEIVPEYRPVEAPPAREVATAAAR